MADTGNFSRAQRTFDRLKHYVGVRLQQGVPIVDEDWNELEDIRKEELRAFLKWFVGDGVPVGDSGFKIEPVEGRLILTPKEKGITSEGRVLVKKVSLQIDQDSTSELLSNLGFDSANAYAQRAAPPPPELISNNIIKSFEIPSSKLVLLLNIDGQAIDRFVVNFSPGEYTAEKVVNTINNNQAVADRVEADIGEKFDFTICPGRCLVDGWDVLNESNIRYSTQTLYDRTEPAGIWDVPPLSTWGEIQPIQGRTDLIYLDVWERQVASPEDPIHLLHPDIQVETCVRTKREWVVRVAIGLADEDELLNYIKDNCCFREEHAYYPLARLVWTFEDEQPNSATEDLRRIELLMASQHNIRQIAADAFGQDYALGHNGLPNLKINLRAAINEILRSQSINTPHKQFTSGNLKNIIRDAFQDNRGDLWLFWESSNPDPFVESRPLIWYKRYDQKSFNWQVNKKLPTEDEYQQDSTVTIDNNGDIWVFWKSFKDDGCKFCFKRYDQKGSEWQNDSIVPGSESFEEYHPITIVNTNKDIWAFWDFAISGDQKQIWFNRLDQDTGRWQGEGEETINSTYGHIMFIADDGGDVWMYWISKNNNNKKDIWCKQYNKSENIWKKDTKLSTDDNADDDYPEAIVDRSGNVWMFWTSEKDDKRNILYRRFEKDSNIWIDASILPTGALDRWSRIMTALVDSHGYIWVFWVSDTHIWYNRYYQNYTRWQVSGTQLTMDNTENYGPIAIVTMEDVWVFWASSTESYVYSDIWYRQYDLNKAQWQDNTQLSAQEAKNIEYTRDSDPIALLDNHGDIWMFWRKITDDEGTGDIYHKKLILNI